MFPQDYNLRLVDMNVRPLTDDDLQWADLVCTSTMIVQRTSLEHVIARAKRAGKPVVAGGPHPTSYWEDIEDVDYFLLGEVEATFPDFLHDLEHGTAQHLYVPQEKPAMTQTPSPGMISSPCEITALCCCNSRAGVRLIASFVISPSCTAACRGPKRLSKCWQNSICCTAWGGAESLSRG